MLIFTQRATHNSDCEPTSLTSKQKRERVGKGIFYVEANQSNYQTIFKSGRAISIGLAPSPILMAGSVTGTNFVVCSYGSIWEIADWLSGMKSKRHNQNGGT